MRNEWPWLSSLATALHCTSKDIFRVMRFDTGWLCRYSLVEPDTNIRLGDAGVQLAWTYMQYVYTCCFGQVRVLTDIIFKLFLRAVLVRSAHVWRREMTERNTARVLHILRRDNTWCHRNWVSFVLLELTSGRHLNWIDEDLWRGEHCLTNHIWAKFVIRLIVKCLSLTEVCLLHRVSYLVREIQTFVLWAVEPRFTCIKILLVLKAVMRHIKGLPSTHLKRWKRLAKRTLNLVVTLTFDTERFALH